MSVQINQYLVYGFYLPFKEARQYLNDKYTEDGYTEIADKYHDSAFKKDIVSINDCSMIEDGMNGEYTFFGKIFKKTSDGCHLETSEMPKVGKKIKDNVKKEFEAMFRDKFSDFHAKIMLITHYR